MPWPKLMLISWACAGTARGAIAAAVVRLTQAAAPLVRQVFPGRPNRLAISCSRPWTAAAFAGRQPARCLRQRRPVGLSELDAAPARRAFARPASAPLPDGVARLQAGAPCWRGSDRWRRRPVDPICTTGAGRAARRREQAAQRAPPVPAPAAVMGRWPIPSVRHVAREPQERARAGDLREPRLPRAAPAPDGLARRRPRAPAAAASVARSGSGMARGSVSPPLARTAGVSRAAAAHRAHDVGFDHHVGRPPDHQQVLDVVAADDDELAGGRRPPRCRSPPAAAGGCAHRPQGAWRRTGAPATWRHRSAARTTTKAMTKFTDVGSSKPKRPFIGRPLACPDARAGRLGYANWLTPTATLAGPNINKELTKAGR